MSPIGKIATAAVAVGVLALLTWLPSFGREARTDDRRQVDVWSWDIAAMALEEVSGEFEAMHPDVDVVTERNGTMLQSRLLLSLIAAKGGPEVAQLQEREGPSFGSTARLVDLTDWARQYEDDFPAAFWASVEHEGRIYAIPWDIGPCAVFYKRWILEKYGIDPSTIETWDDFIRAGNLLAERSGGASRMMPMSTGDPGDIFFITMQQNGGGIFDAEGRIILHQRANVEALELLGRLYDSNATAPMPGWGPEYLGSFSTDVVACYPAAAWLSQNIKDNVDASTAGQWGVFRLPALEPGGLRNSNYGGSLLVIPEGSAEPEAAAEFIEYALCTVEGQIEQYKTYGLFPGFLPAHDAPYFDEPDPFYGGQKVSRLFAEDFERVPPLIRTADWMDAERLVRQSLSEYAAKRPDEQAFLENVARAMAEQLRRPLAPLDEQGNPIPPAEQEEA